MHILICIYNQQLLKNDRSSDSQEDREDDTAIGPTGEICSMCRQIEPDDDHDLLQCSQCQQSYHRRCHEPPIPPEEDIINDSWNCSDCHTELNIGSALAENLHTALDGEDSKRGKKRQRTDSVEASMDEAGSEESTVSQELRALRGQIHELQHDKTAMQQRLDDVINSQKKKDAQVEELKKAVDSLNANLMEKPSKSPC